VGQAAKRLRTEVAEEAEAEQALREGGTEVDVEAEAEDAAMAEADDVHAAAAPLRLSRQDVESLEGRLIGACSGQRPVRLQLLSLAAAHPRA